MSWTLYYADGSKYSDRDGSAENSPKDFLIAIAQDSEHFGRTVMTGEYFIFKNGAWSFHDLPGLIDQVKHYAKDIVVMRPGHYVDNRTFHQITERARTES